MHQYDYPAAVKNDVLAYIKMYNMVTPQTLRGQLYDDLMDALYHEPPVTGTEAAPYFNDRVDAAAALAFNWDLLAEALSNDRPEQWIDGWNKPFWDYNPIDEGEQWCDMVIRCYLLSSAIDDAIKEVLPNA